MGITELSMTHCNTQGVRHDLAPYYLTTATKERRQTLIKDAQLFPIAVSA